MKLSIKLRSSLGYCSPMTKRKASHHPKIWALFIPPRKAVQPANVPSSSSVTRFGSSFQGNSLPLPSPSVVFVVVVVVRLSHGKNHISFGICFCFVSTFMTLCLLKALLLCCNSSSQEHQEQLYCM